MTSASDKIRGSLKKSSPKTETLNSEQELTQEMASDSAETNSASTPKEK
jgi:hypothetical protein